MICPSFSGRQILDRLLLDTHIALWAVTADDALAKRATELILAADAGFVCAASIWEISIKHAVKPSSMPISGTAALVSTPV